MKKLILKSGLFRHSNRFKDPQENELDVERYIKRLLTYLGVSYVDPCCPIDEDLPPVPTGQELQEQISSMQELIDNLTARIEELETP